MIENMKETAILDCGSEILIDEDRQITLVVYRNCDECDLFFEHCNLEHIPIEYHRSIFMRQKEGKKWDGNP